MGSAIGFLETAGYFVLLVALAGAGYAGLRHRDRHQGDLFFALASMIVILALTKLRGLTASEHLVQSFLFLFFLAQPFFLMRLVQHFRHVPRGLQWATGMLTAAGTVAVLALPRPRPIAVVIAITVYFVVIQGYAAWAFVTESKVSAGVTGWRLRLAAMGAGLFAAVVLITNAVPFLPPLAHTAASVTRLLSFGMVIGYCFGLATPRSMRRIWQRGELYRFLRETAERDPADRGEHAAEDLSRAASRGVPATANAVLLGQSPLVVRASSDPPWLGRSVVPATGLIGRAPGSPAVGAPADCEGEFAELTAAAGDHVITVPIAARGEHWGVLLVVQRRGSLFPDDDIELLLRLCRYTADTLEHSRLLASERERQRREADVLLRNSESRLHLMLESIKDYAMITIDNAGLVTSWNVGARDVFGHATGAILGRPVTDLFGPDWVALPGDLAEAGRTGRAAHEGVCTRADGSSFTGSTVIRPLRRTGEATDGFVVVTRDVTERRQLEARLRQAQKMEAVGRLAGGVAHDFNNLLLVILGYGAELDAAPLNDAQRTGVVEILKAAEQAATLTRQLLAFSRQQVLEPRIVSLSALLRDVLPMLTRLLGEHIEIVRQIEEVPSILADPGQLHQIVVNLAVNARDAMVGGGRLTIRTTSVVVDQTFTWTHLEARPGAFAVLEVTDTGTGMDESIRTRIFEPFFTTKEFGRGTGLGLATVYGIVKQMQGGISVRSEIGHGTTFTVYIPLADGDTDATLLPAAVSVEPGVGSGTVLLVEDDPSVRLLVASILARDGYRVISAQNLLEAVTKVAESGSVLRLIITDVVMPGGSGPELIARLAATHPSVHTLFMSGYAEASFNQGGPNASHHFLQKPFTGKELIAKIRKILS